MEDDTVIMDLPSEDGPDLRVSVPREHADKVQRVDFTPEAES